MLKFETLTPNRTFAGLVTDECPGLVDVLVVTLQFDHRRIRPLLELLFSIETLLRFLESVHGITTIQRLMVEPFIGYSSESEGITIFHKFDDGQFCRDPCAKIRVIYASYIFLRGFQKYRYAKICTARKCLVSTKNSTQRF